MWNFTVELIFIAVSSAFGWFQAILDSAPGTWGSLLTIFIIFTISRFLLGPVLGVAFSGLGSDIAKKSKGDNDG